MNNLTNKTCRKCRLEKPLDQFSKCARSKDNRDSHCRACVRIRNAAAYARDPVRGRLMRRQSYYRMHPGAKPRPGQQISLAERRARAAAYTQKYDARMRAENPVEYLAKRAAEARAWRAANRERSREIALKGQRVYQARLKAEKAKTQ